MTDRIDRLSQEPQDRESKNEAVNGIARLAKSKGAKALGVISALALTEGVNEAKAGSLVIGLAEGQAKADIRTETGEQILVNLPAGKYTSVIDAKGENGRAILSTWDGDYGDGESGLVEVKNATTSSPSATLQFPMNSPGKLVLNPEENTIAVGSYNEGTLYIINNDWSDSKTYHALEGVTVWAVGADEGSNQPWAIASYSEGGTGKLAVIDLSNDTVVFEENFSSNTDYHGLGLELDRESNEAFLSGAGTLWKITINEQNLALSTSETMETPDANGHLIAGGELELIGEDKILLGGASMETDNVDYNCNATLYDRDGNFLNQVSLTDGCGNYSILTVDQEGSKGYLSTSASLDIQEFDLNTMTLTGGGYNASYGVASITYVPDSAADSDADGHPSTTDCDDTNPDINPDAEEVCDGQDNDCDTEIDEDGGQTYYQDADGDGFGNSEQSIESCEEPAGGQGFTIEGIEYVSNAGDCNDDNNSVNPDAEEVCGNETDENCDGVVEECEISPSPTPEGDDDDSTQEGDDDDDTTGEGGTPAPAGECTLDGETAWGPTCGDYQFSTETGTYTIHGDGETQGVELSLESSTEETVLEVLAAEGVDTSNLTVSRDEGGPIIVQGDNWHAAIEGSTGQYNFHSETTDIATKAEEGYHYQVVTLGEDEEAITLPRLEGGYSMTIDIDANLINTNSETIRQAWEEAQGTEETPGETEVDSTQSPEEEAPSCGGCSHLEEHPNGGLGFTGLAMGIYLAVHRLRRREIEESLEKRA